jgi:hypothetical protein
VGRIGEALQFVCEVLKLTYFLQDFSRWNKSGIIFYQFGINGIISVVTWKNLAKKIWRPWLGVQTNAVAEWASLFNHQ